MLGIVLSLLSASICHEYDIWDNIGPFFKPLFSGHLHKSLHLNRSIKITSLDSNQTSAEIFKKILKGTIFYRKSAVRCQHKYCNKQYNKQHISYI